MNIEGEITDNPDQIAEISQRIRRDYVEFAQTILCDDAGKGLVLAPIHIAWIAHAHYAWERGKGVVINAPVSHGKSTVVAVGMPLHALSQDPNIRVKIISATDDLAADRVTGIRSIIDNSPEFRAYCPHVRASKKDREAVSAKKMWARKKFFLQRSGQSLDASVEGYGILSSGVGGRCVLPGTWICGPGGPCAIEEIGPIGWRVLGSSGKYEWVEGTASREFDGEAVSFRVEGFHRPIEVTPEHPVRVLRGMEFLWVRADALVKGDFVVMPRAKACSTHAVYNTKRMLLENREAEELMHDMGVWRIFGYYLGDGWLKDPVGLEARGSSNSAWFALNAAKHADHMIASDIVRTARRIGATYTIQKRDSVLLIRVCHARLTSLLRKFGDGCLQKRIPGWAERASRERQRNLLRGLWGADGWQDGRIAGIVSANEKMLAQAHLMLLSAGVPSSMHLTRPPGTPTTINGKVSITAGLWTVASTHPATRAFLGAEAAPYAERDLFRQYALPRHLVLPIRDICRRPYKGPVYDIGVPATRDFAAFGALLHNSDFMVIDDPVDEKNSQSDVTRRRVLNQFEKIWMTRLTPKARWIMISTPYHHDDLNAHLRKNPDVCVLEQAISEDFGSVDFKVYNTDTDHPLYALST